MSLFEHVSKVLSLYLEASIRIRIKVKGRIRVLEENPDHRYENPERHQQFSISPLMPMPSRSIYAALGRTSPTSAGQPHACHRRRLLLLRVPGRLHLRKHKYCVKRKWLSDPVSVRYSNRTRCRKTNRVHNEGVRRVIHIERNNRLIQKLKK